MNKKYEQPKILKELHCPYCASSVGVIGEVTETFHQHVAYCKRCKCEFTVSHFKATAYLDITGGKANE